MSSVVLDQVGAQLGGGTFGLLHGARATFHAVSKTAPAQGVCSFSKRPHNILSGASSGQKLRTAAAQEYPARLCTAIAKVLSRASDKIQMARMTQIQGGKDQCSLAVLPNSLFGHIGV